MLDRIAFAALIKRKRGELGLSQQKLAERIWDDSGRKGDISRLENGKVTPQEQTIRYLCDALNISDAEMAPIRSGRSTDQQIDQIPTLSLEGLQELAARFEISGAFDRSEAELRLLLKERAEEYRQLKRDLQAVRETMPQLDNVVAEALRLLDGDKIDTTAVRAMIRDARKNLQEAVLIDALSKDAQLAEIEARTELFENRPEQAFAILSAAADSFGGIDRLEPARRRLRYAALLYQHGLRYGGAGLALAAEMNTAALTHLNVSDTPALWAKAQSNLAIALQAQGSRTAGQEGTTLLSRAVTAYEAALEVRTRTDHPVQWATTMQNLAGALLEQGKRTAGQAGTTLLSRAVTAYEAALEITTRTEHPVDWATTMQNLAIALRNQGSRTDGQAGTTLLSRAVTAFEAALEVRTRNDHPVQWATTMQNLAIALQQQGKRTAGQAGTTLLSRAVTAYEDALEVRTRADHPVQWATTMQNLAIALREQGSRTAGQAGTTLLSRAVTAYEDALEVTTRADHPVQWAGTMQNLAGALLEQGSRTAGQAGTTLLSRAVAALEDALGFHPR